MRGTGFLSKWRSSSWEMYLDSRELLFDDGSTRFPMHELVNVKLRGMSKAIQVHKSTGLIQSSSSLQPVLLVLKLSASTFSGSVKQHVSIAFADQEDLKDFLAGFQATCNHHNLIEAFSHNRDILILMSELLLEGSMEIPTEPSDSDDEDGNENYSKHNDSGNTYRNDLHGTYSSASSGGESSVVTKSTKQNRKASITYENYFQYSVNDTESDKIIFQENTSMKALSQRDGNSPASTSPQAGKSQSQFCRLREEDSKIKSVLGIERPSMRERGDIEMGNHRYDIGHMESDSDIHMGTNIEHRENGNDGEGGGLADLLKGFKKFGKRFSNFNLVNFGMGSRSTSYKPVTGKDSNRDSSRVDGTANGLEPRSYSSGVVRRRHSNVGHKSIRIDQMNRDFEDIRGISAMELRRDRMNSVSSLFNEGFVITGESAFDSIVSKRRSTMMTAAVSSLRPRTQSAESTGSEEKIINEFKISILSKQGTIPIAKNEQVDTEESQAETSNDQNIVQKVHNITKMVGRTFDEVIHGGSTSSEAEFVTRTVILSTEQLVLKAESKNGREDKEGDTSRNGNKTKSPASDSSYGIDNDRSHDIIYPMQRVVVSVVLDDEDDDIHVRSDSSDTTHENSRVSIIGSIEKEAATLTKKGDTKLTTFKMKFYDDQKFRKGVVYNQAKGDFSENIGGETGAKTSCNELVFTLNNKCPNSRKFFRAVAYHACVHNVLALYYDMGWDLFDENDNALERTRAEDRSPPLGLPERLRTDTTGSLKEKGRLTEKEKELKMKKIESDRERELAGTLTNTRPRLDSDDDGSSQHKFDSHEDLDYDDMFIALLRSNRSEVDVSGWMLDTEKFMKVLRRRLQKRPVVYQNESEETEEVDDESDTTKKRKQLQKNADKLERKNFKSRPEVLRLLACDCQVDDEFMMMLARTMNSVRSVEYLDVSWNPIGFKGGVAISNMLFSTAGFYLLELNLSNCQVGDVVMGQIADALLTPTCNLNILNVSENNITKLGCSYIAGSLKENTRLRELNLSNNAIGSMGARDLAACLSDNNTLCILNVNSQYKQIGPEGAVHLARLLRMEYSSIQVLRVGGNAIGFDGCRHLASSLLVNTKLQELDLGGINYITIAGAKQIAQALLHNVSLSHITVGQVRLPVFDLRGVEYLVLETLGQRVPYPPSEIDLTKCMLEEYTESYEGMRDEMAIVAVTLMQKNTYLRHIKMSLDSDFIPVAMLNGTHPSCKTLDLSNKNYKGIDAIVIGGLMAQNRFLTEICLEGNDFAGSEGENWIAYALEHSQIRFDASRWNVKQMYVDGYKTLASMRGLSASGAFIEPQRLEGCFYEFLTIWAGVMYYYTFAADVVAINQMRENEEKYKESWVIFYCVFVCLPTLLQCKNSLRVVFHDPMRGIREMLLIVFQTTAFYTTKASVKNNMETTEYLDHKYVNGVYRTIPLIILQFYITFVVVEKNGTLFGAEYLVQASFLSLIGVTVIFIMLYDRMHARRMSMLPRKEQPGCAIWLADWLATCGMGADDDAVEGFVNFDAFYTSHYVWAWIYQFLSLSARVISTTWFVASVLMIDPYKTGELAGILLIVVMFGTRFIYSYFMEDVDIKNISGFFSHIVHCIELLITDSAFKLKEDDEGVESNLRNWIILISWTNVENLFCCIYGCFFNDYSQLATSAREALFIIVVVCILCRCLLFYFWLSVVHFPSLYVTGDIILTEEKEKAMNIKHFSQLDPSNSGNLMDTSVDQISSTSNSPARPPTRRRSELFERLKSRKKSWDVNAQLNKLKFKTEKAVDNKV